MRKLISILVLISFCLSATAQSNVDSLLSLLTKKQRDTARIMTFCRLSIAYASKDPDQGMIYAQKGLDFAEQKKFTQGSAAANAGLGICMNAKGKFNEANDYLDRALGLYRGINDVLGQGAVVGKMADNFNSAGDYQRALEHYLQSLRFKEVQRDTVAIAITLESMAVVYFNLDQKILGVAELKQTLEILRTGDHKKELAHCYFVISNLIFNDHYECDSAIYFLRKSTKILDELGEEKESLEYKNYLAKKIYECASKEEGKKLAEEILKRSSEKKYEVAMCDAYGNLAVMNNEEGNYSKGLEQGTQALKLAKQLNERSRYMNLYGGLERSYRGLNDLRNAFTYSDLFIHMKDSLRNDSVSKHFFNMQARYEVERKEKEKILEEADKDKKDTADAHLTILIRSTATIIVLVALLIFFVLKGRKEKKNFTKEIAEKKIIIEDKDLEIADSITNAKSLQDAILPPHTFMKQYFSESFIFFRPKDVVSGDFYWMEVIGDYVYLAVADCTGQGVPGAMVSVVCSTALSRAVKEFGITDTGKILDKVSILVLETFRKRESDVRDGMDISLVRIHMKTNAAQWSGANIPLWYVRNKELIEVAADKQTIGKSEKKEAFTTRDINFQKGDSVFLFTDGYADQFGEKEGKKFKYSNLKKLLVSLDERRLPEQKLIIDAKLESWKGNLQQVDDILVVGVRI